MTNPFSSIALIACWFFIVSIAFFYYPKWKQRGNEATIGYDVAGYYQYLPAVFIYHDLRNLEFQQQIFEKYHLGTGYPNYTAETGYQVIKYSLGAALFYTPFFLTGHLVALYGTHPADGYSRPYQAALSFGCLIYALIGLVFARKILLLYFDDTVTAITLWLLVFGTNYLNYTAVDHAMTHNLLFTLFTCIIYLTIQFYKQPGFAIACIIGLLCGLAIITRPSEIVIASLPILWGINGYTAIKQRMQFIAMHWGKIIVSAAGGLAVICLQLFYWKYTSGNFIEYSYGDQGFQFFNAFFYQVLFSFRKGWFVYTPLMLLIVPGFIFLFIYRRSLFMACLVFFLLTFWIVASWEIWWYGGSLGQRALVQSYAILIFPLAAFVQFILQAPNSVKIPAGIFIAFCIVFNIFLTWQAHAPGGIFEAENMNRTYFWKIFFKAEIPPSEKRFLDKADLYRGKMESIVPVEKINFESDTIGITHDIVFEGNNARIIHAEHPYYSYSIPKEKIGTHKWIRISAMCYTPDKEWNIWQAEQLVVWFKKGDEQLKTNFIRIQRLIDSGIWTEVWFEAKVPDAEFDTVEVAVLHLGSSKTLMIDNISVFAFN
ncbi:MAG: hypothetical protein ACK4IY_04525 [Chitinophagales bacterium]